MMEHVYRYTFHIFTQIFSWPMVPQDLKAAGMPANEAGPGTSRGKLQMRWHLGQIEASRINQYNMFLSRNFEKLWSVDLNSKIRYCELFRVS